MPSDPIQTVNEKWNLVIGNIENELALLQIELKNPDRLSKTKECFDVLGDYELKFIVESERKVYEGLIRCYIAIRQAQGKWIKELHETVDSMMQEEYQDKLARKEKRIREAPRILRNGIPRPVIPIESKPITKVNAINKHLEPKPIDIKKLTKDEKMEIVKRAYFELRADERTVARIAKKTGLGNGTVYRYTTQYLGLQLSGKFRTKDN